MPWKFLHMCMCACACACVHMCICACVPRSLTGALCGVGDELRGMLLHVVQVLDGGGACVWGRGAAGGGRWERWVPIHVVHSCVGGEFSGSQGSEAVEAALREEQRAREEQPLTSMAFLAILPPPHGPTPNRPAHRDGRPPRPQLQTEAAAREAAGRQALVEGQAVAELQGAGAQRPRGAGLRAVG